MEAWTAFLAPLVVALVEVGKRAGLPVRWAPLVAIALGVGLVWALTYQPTAAAVVVWGLIIGATAAGLYSGGRAVLGK